MNNLARTGKYIGFVVIKNTYGRTNEEKPCFDDFAISQIRWEISPISPKTIDSYLTALLSVVPWNQRPWICFGVTISWFILALQSLKVSASALAITNTTFGSVEFFSGLEFRGENNETNFGSTVTWKLTACSISSNGALFWYAIQGWLSSKSWGGKRLQPSKLETWTIWKPKPSTLNAKNRLVISSASKN